MIFSTRPLFFIHFIFFASHLDFTYSQFIRALSVAMRKFSIEIFRTNFHCFGVENDERLNSLFAYAAQAFYGAWNSIFFTRKSTKRHRRYHFVFFFFCELFCNNFIRFFLGFILRHQFIHVRH